MGATGRGASWQGWEREGGMGEGGRETFSLGFPFLNKPLITHFFVLNKRFPEGHQRGWLQFF